VKDFLAEFFAARTQAEALAWLADIDVCYAPLRTLVEAYDDPHVTERGMLLHDEQGLPHTGTAIKFTREPAQIGFAVPRLGEHSRAIAAELGYAAEEIEALARDGVI
jgi:crotonobetainyl-CoA:carnitine CoA-transferase CaiB-like acyl-CoA transferase